jgi:hypothetical protein
MNVDNDAWRRAAQEHREQSRSLDETFWDQAKRYAPSLVRPATYQATINVQPQMIDGFNTVELKVGDIVIICGFEMELVAISTVTGEIVLKDRLFARKPW